MPSILSLSGAGSRRRRRGLGAPPADEGDRCRCVKNPRTGRTTKICFVGKSKKHRSGWKIVGVCR
jgi:hypothetical protein